MNGKEFFSDNHPELPYPLPCPFCGEEAKMGTSKNEREEACGWYIYCTNVRYCGVHTYTMDSESEAVSIWNRRRNDGA